jgi:hypothetical protein
LGNSIVLPSGGGHFSSTARSCFVQQCDVPKGRSAGQSKKFTPDVVFSGLEHTISWNDSR